MDPRDHPVKSRASLVEETLTGFIRWTAEGKVIPLNLLEKLSTRVGASALSGMLLFECFQNFDWNRLVWVACCPLIVAVCCEAKLLRAFFLGCLAGAIFLAGSCYWFVYVMGHYGGLSRAAAEGTLLLFVLVFSVFFGAFALLEAWVARFSRAYALALSPFLWVTMELARTYLITGFPWNLLGYALDAPGLRQLASVTAVYGLSFLAVVSSALLAWLILKPHRAGAWLALALWLNLLAVGNWAATPAPLTPGSNIAFLVQPDAPLDETALEQWAPWQHAAPLNGLVRMTEESVERATIATPSPPLVVWSENPAPFYFFRDPIFRGAIKKMARQTRAYTVVGTVTSSGPDNRSLKNTAVVLDPTGQVLLQYDKIRLVPFGEYVPAWAFPGKIGKITMEVGDFVPGSNYSVAETPQGAIGVFICYEAIFPQLVRRITAAGAAVLVNISDDTWYGDTAGPLQHLEMARLRAIENGRYLLRATNDGVTVAIDPQGRLLDQLPRHRPLVLPARFDYVKDRTFYTDHGDVFAWLCVIVSILVVGTAAQRKMSMRRESQSSGIKSGTPKKNWSGGQGQATRD